MSGDRTWAGVVSPAGSGENSAPPVQGWPTMGGRDLNIQCSREDEEFGVCGHSRDCLGRELSRGTKRRLAAALQTGPEGRNIQCPISNVQGNVRGSDVGRGCIPGGIGREQRATRARVAYNGGKRSQCPISNDQCSREDEEFGVRGRGRDCLGRELSRGTKRRLAAALQTGPGGRNIQCPISNVQGNVRGSDVGRGCIPGGIGREQRATRARVAYNGGKRSQYPMFKGR